MFCTKCGAASGGSSESCTACGNPFGNKVRYAGFWRRLAAYVADYIILSILLYPTGRIDSGSTKAVIAAAQIHGFGSAQFQSRLDSGFFYIALWCGIVGLAWWVYFTLFESSALQATPGKLLIGIRVIGLEGKRISFGRANVRYWGKALSSLILLIGFAMAGFTARKQALHDLLARTLVVRRPGGIVTKEI